MKNRDGNIDLWRFIAALLIMAHHLYHVGLTEYPFKDTWIYVEFFLLITGFYTAKHFDGCVSENRSRSALLYTIKKFVPMLPYTITITILAFLTQGVVNVVFNVWSYESFVSSFLYDFLYDILLLSDAFSGPLIVPLWYLSTMVIVFPIFALFVQLKNRYLKIIIAFSFSIAYFGYTGVSGNRNFPYNIFRVLSGMLLGVCIYEFLAIVKERRFNKVFLTIIELLLLAYPLIASYNNWASEGHTLYRLYLLCFVIALTISFSGASYTSAINGKWCRYLGKLSMPMYIIHWYIGTLVEGISKLIPLNNGIKVLIYYIATIMASMLSMMLISKWRWFQEMLIRVKKLD